MILWFSGTGNSRYVAERLAAETGERVVEMRRLSVSSPIRVDGSDRRVVWVCPVYSWGIPPYVRSVISRVGFELSSADDGKGYDDNDGGGKDLSLVHHLVLTCGDDCGLAPEMWRKDIGRRGWQSGVVCSVVMPNNYVSMTGFDVDPKDVERKKLADAPGRVAEIARRLADYVADRLRHGGGDDGNNDGNNDVVRGRFPWVKTKVVYPWFVRHAMSPKPFHTTDDCISCGKCAAVCPTGNIVMTLADESDSSGRRRKRPVWADDCAGCLGCYHICPRHAVRYGSATDEKGQYFNPFVRTL